MRDFVHVDDVARANVLALRAVAGRDGSAAYNVCSGRPIAIGEVAALIAEGARRPREPRVTGASGRATSGTWWPRPLRAARPSWGSTPP